MRRHVSLSILVVSLLMLAASFTSAAQKGSPLSAMEEGKGIRVWSEVKEGDSIFIRIQDGDQWGEPMRVSVNGDVNLVPTVVRKAADSVFVIWSTFTTGQSELHYREMKDGEWTDEAVYYTGLTSNTAPSLAVDGSGTMWLAWSGFNGLNDEIYIAKWEGLSFSTARAITSNDVPDILPVLGIDEGSGLPFVQWHRYSEEGYQAVESAWNGLSWTDPVGISR